MSANYLRPGGLGALMLAATVMVTAPACEQDPSSTAQNIEASTETSAALPLGSREYKLMLDPGLFAGNQPEAAIDAFQQDLLAEIAAQLDRPVEGDLTELDKTRTVRFYDTPGDCQLRAAGWIFRERIKGDEREVTLKFRSVDRYVAASKDLSPDSGLDGKTKFEEDIKPPYTSIFSQSTKLPIGANKNLNHMDDPIGLFPGLDEEGLDQERELGVVSGLTVNERVYGDLVIDLGKLEAEMSLTLWAPEGEADPAVAEVSFGIESDDESYPAKSVTRAMKLFEILQQLDSWQAPESVTKTAFAYGYDPSFCGG